MENKANKERAQLWQERVAQLQASGVSQRAYAMEHGFSRSSTILVVKVYTIPMTAPLMRQNRESRPSTDGGVFVSKNPFHAQDPSCGSCRT